MHRVRFGFGLFFIGLGVALLAAGVAGLLIGGVSSPNNDSEVALVGGFLLLLGSSMVEFSFSETKA